MNRRTQHPRFPYPDLHQAAGHPSAADLAGLIGVSPRTIMRWRKCGVPGHQADRAAIRIGSHPSVVWPSSW